MRFVNQTGFEADWTFGYEPDGREMLVVIVKATFDIPDDATLPRKAAEQAVLTEEDRFTGEPGLSAPLLESDYAHRKPLCDVIINGSAHAPAGRPHTEVIAGFRVGALTKALVVKGTRRWQQHLMRCVPGAPEPFLRMPISYDVAFGGVDKSDPAHVRSFSQNPVGRGFAPNRRDLDGMFLPNTEKVGEAVSTTTGLYTPMSFGSIGRGWAPRIRHAGTYDKTWLETRAPVWPDDFDYRYFQCAPPNQQMPYPQGGEQVVLKNLSAAGLTRFTLPTVDMPVLFISNGAADHELHAVIDTVLIEPDAQRFMLTFRACLPLRRSLFDLKSVIVGPRSSAWDRARRYPNRAYYRNLAELVKARGRRRPAAAPGKKQS